ncbi:hypothetical protein GEMRC1_002689 [Eukaryota sp. GEM-RC1]
MKKRPIKKYNHDGTKGPLIYIFRNGQINETGVALAVNPQRIHTMQHLYDKATSILRPFTGPVRKVYNLDGKMIRGLQEFQDRKAYIVCSGESFDYHRIARAAISRNAIQENKIVAKVVPIHRANCDNESSNTIEINHLPSSPLGKPRSVPKPVMETVQRLRIGTSVPSLPNTQLFHIRVFENGHSCHDGVSLAVVPPKLSDATSSHFKDLFIEFLSQCRDALDKYINNNRDASWNFQDLSDHRIFSGNCTGLFTPSGLEIKSISQLKPDQPYIAVRNFEPFDASQIPLTLTQIPASQDIHSSPRNLRSEPPPSLPTSRLSSTPAQPVLLSSVVSNLCIQKRFPS